MPLSVIYNKVCTSLLSIHYIITCSILCCMSLATITYVSVTFHTIILIETTKLDLLTSNKNFTTKVNHNKVDYPTMPFMTLY